MSQVAANRLARICAYSGSAPEWEQFVRLVTPVVMLSARRVSSIWGDAAGTALHEIAQEVFLKLCENERRILRDFEDRGNESFLKMLRMISASVATDHYRRSQAEKRGGRSSRNGAEAHAEVESLTDPRATDAIVRQLLVAQLDGLLRLSPESVSARDRKLFWLHYRHGMSAQAISRIPAIGLSAKGVESALLRLTRLLRDTIESRKPKLQLNRLEPAHFRQEKGISGVIAINTVKDR